MNTFWIGYHLVAWVRVSTVKDGRFTELYADASGLPLFVNGQKVYIAPGMAALLKKATFYMIVSSVEVRRDRPVGPRYEYSSKHRDWAHCWLDRGTGVAAFDDHETDYVGW